MAQGKTNDREARTRLRAYQSRLSLHNRRAKRRVRDNVLISVIAVVVIALAAVAQITYQTTGPGAPVAEPTATATPTPAATDANTGDVPSSDIAEGRSWSGSMTINTDALGFTLDGAAAPQAVSSFISLTQSGFYDGISCHRLTTDGLYVLQCGDPNGDGSGGPGYSYGPVENAPADDVYPAGTIAMARQSGNGYSQGSQFFIVYQDTTLPTDAAGGYTILGQVTSGLDALQADVIAAGTADGSTDGAPAVAVTIESVTLQ